MNRTLSEKWQKLRAANGMRGSELLNQPKGIWLTHQPTRLEGGEAEDEVEQHRFGGGGEVGETARRRHRLLRLRPRLHDKI